MQPSELYRRGIVVPLDQEAEESLRSYDVEKDTQVRLLRIDDDKLFESLWRLGLFDEINRRCGSLVDDYEEEMVEASSVHKILDVSDVLASTASGDSRSLKFLEDFQKLVREALTLSRPVLFVL